MASMFDRNDAGPISQLGPGFTAGNQIPPWTPDLAAQMTRGAVPVVFSVNPLVKTFQTGRQNGGWVPYDTMLEVINRGATYSAPPLFSVGRTNSSGFASLSLEAPAVDTPAATFQGRDYRYIAFAIDITGNNNTNNGQMVITASGTFEDGDAYDQQIVALPSIVGTARYYLITSQQFDGGTYPELIVLQNQRLAAPRGTAIQLLFGTEDLEDATLTQDLRNNPVGINFTFQGGAGLDLFITALKPGNELWDEFYGYVKLIGKQTGAK